MDKKLQIERLKNLKDALSRSFDNLIAILNEEIDTVEKENKEEIVLKDSQIKVYAEGISKAAETAGKILNQIKAIEDEIISLEKEKPPKKISEESKNEIEETQMKSIEDKNSEDEDTEYPLEKHLE